MRKVLRGGQLVPDDWCYLGEEPAGGAESVIIPLAELRGDNAATWRAWRGRLGVRIGPADKVEDFAAELPRLALVAAEFTGPSEGRGYTQARLLRERYKFAGEMRAVNVKQDQIFFLARCGFTAFELAPGESFEDARRALERFTVAYQPAAADASVRRKRFHYPH